jgi:hypothetical protein
VVVAVVVGGVLGWTHLAGSHTESPRKTGSISTQRHLGVLQVPTPGVPTSVEYGSLLRHAGAFPEKAGVFAGANITQGTRFSSFVAAAPGDRLLFRVLLDNRSSEVPRVFQVRARIEAPSMDNNTDLWVTRTVGRLPRDRYVQNAVIETSNKNRIVLQSGTTFVVSLYDTIAAPAIGKTMLGEGVRSTPIPAGRAAFLDFQAVVYRASNFDNGFVEGDFLDCKAHPEDFVRVAVHPDNGGIVTCTVSIENGGPGSLHDVRARWGARRAFKFKGESNSELLSVTAQARDAQPEATETSALVYGTPSEDPEIAYIHDSATLRDGQGHLLRRGDGLTDGSIPIARVLKAGERRVVKLKFKIEFHAVR